ncbi:MAG: signal peptidase I [Geobacter sp.]|nr:signal peptidase I [Geobacter sp.]
MNPKQKEKPGANPRIAFLLSLIVPGLGQVYAGQPERGMFCYAFGYLFALALCLGNLALSFRGLLLLAGTLFLLALLASADAYSLARKSRAPALAPYNKWYVHVIAIILNTVVAGPLITFAVRGPTGISITRVASNTLEPALMEGDYVVLGLCPYERDLPGRGDVVVFPYAKDPSKKFIKRVVGLEGESVEIVHKRVHIDGREFVDPWGVFHDREVVPASKGPRDNIPRIVVPRGYVFVLGDNRDISFDSRYYGPVETRTIVGKALYVLWGKGKRSGIKVR